MGTICDFSWGSVDIDIREDKLYLKFSPERPTLKQFNEAMGVVKRAIDYANALTGENINIVGEADILEAFERTQQ